MDSLADILSETSTSNVTMGTSEEGVDYLDFTIADGKGRTKHRAYFLTKYNIYDVATDLDMKPYKVFSRTTMEPREFVSRTILRKKSTDEQYHTYGIANYWVFILDGDLISTTEENIRFLSSINLSTIKAKPRS